MIFAESILLWCKYCRKHLTKYENLLWRKASSIWNRHKHTYWHIQKLSATDWDFSIQSSFGIHLFTIDIFKNFTMQAMRKRFFNKIKNSLYLILWEIELILSKPFHSFPIFSTHFTENDRNIIPWLVFLISVIKYNTDDETENKRIVWIESN